MGGVDLLLLIQSWKLLGDAAGGTLSTHSATLWLSRPTAGQEDDITSCCLWPNNKDAKAGTAWGGVLNGSPHTHWRLIAAVLPTGQHRSRKRWFWIHHLLRLSSPGAGSGRR